MISTLENVRLKSGDRIRVKVGDSLYPARVIDASDPSKLRVELQNGAILWTGRRSVESILEYILVKRSEWKDFSTVGKECGIDFTYSQEDDGIHVHDFLDEAEDILWAIQAQNEYAAGVQEPEAAISHK